MKMKTIRFRTADRVTIFIWSLKTCVSLVIIISLVTIALGLLKLSLKGDGNQNDDSSNLRQNCVKPDPLLYFTTIEKKLDTLKQDDQSLIEYVRIRYMTSPSHRPYPVENTKLAKERKNVSDRFGEFVSTVFEKKV